jgi:hypothetical protein
MRQPDVRVGLLERIGLANFRDVVDRWTVALDTRVLRPYAQFPVRLAFGNDAGLLENITGLKAFARDARNPHLTSENAAKRSIQALKHQGFAVLGYPFAPELIHDLRDEFVAALADSTPSGAPQPYRFLADPVESMPSLREVLHSPLLEELSAMYERGSQLMYFRAWRNYSWPTDRASVEDFNSNLWHNDQARTDIIKVFVLLSDDVSAENGATRLLSKTDTKAVMRRGYLHRTAMTRRAMRYLESPERVQYMEGNCGFTYVFNPQMCLHGAGNARLGQHRDVLMLQFCGR